MRKMIVLFIVLACCFSVSWAQQPTPAALAKWDAFAGYSFSRIYVANETPFPMNLQGGQGAVTYYFTRHLGATAEVAAYTKDVDETTFHTQGYLFGPTARFGPRNSRYSFFAHQLFGVTHMSFTADPSADCTDVCSITTHPFTMASGGGVDVKVSKHLWVRPLQLEYFNEQISLSSLDIGPGLVGGTGPRSAAHAYATDLFDGIKITGQGLRYTAGADYRF
jgi:hypothetical protein